MSNSETPSPGSTDPQVPDKAGLYGKFQQAQDWRDNLQRLAAFKSLDMAVPEDMNITNNTTSKTGMGAMGVAGVALGSGILPALLMAGLSFLHSAGNAAVAPTNVKKDDVSRVIERTKDYNVKDAVKYVPSTEKK